MYIAREIDTKILAYFRHPGARCMILAGVVGCGKTTLIEKILTELEGELQVFRFTGDDAVFRESLRRDSKFLFQSVRAKTSQRALIFIDEIQKCDNVFDAVKFAFDHGLSVIISGSNPEFLASQARKRLQRRSAFFQLQPFSLVEILQHQGLIDSATSRRFIDFLWAGTTLDDLVLPKISVTGDLTKILDRYFAVGGLPLSHLAQSQHESLSEIQKTVERGFEPIYQDAHNLFDAVIIDLARQHSREFSYQGLFQRTGLRRRDVVNGIILQLKNHGYLVDKRPYFPEKDDRRSYLVVHSYVDPGMVSYLTGEIDDDNSGFRVEGVVHSRLQFHRQFVPLKSQLNYFKPYTIDTNDKVKFKPGEIDFVCKIGKRVIPIEAKSTSHLAQINTELLENFIQTHRCPFGVVFYGGVPFIDRKKKIVFWSYWLF